MLLTVPDLRGPKTVDSTNIIRYFGFCTVVDVNVILKVLYVFKDKDWKVWFLPTTIDCNCDASLLSC